MLDFKRALALMILLTAVAQSTTAKDAILLDRVVAIVDDDIVMQSELDSRVRSVSNRLRSQGASLPSLSVMESRVLNQLLLESIQLQLANRAGIRVSDNQLNETINNIARSNNLSLEQFEAELRREGETYSDAREQIRREMLVSRVQQREIDRRVRVTEQEVDNYLASKEGRTQSGTEYYVGHILIAVSESASAEQRQLAEAKAQRVLGALQNGADFQKTAVAESDGRQALNGGIIGWRKETELPSIAADILPGLAVGEPSDLLRSGSGIHIIASLDKRGGEQQIIKQFKVRHILVSPNEIRSDAEAKANINKLYQRILSGDDFAELARENSDDPVSAIDGGDLDWVSLGQMVPQFEAEMLASEIGQTRPPFRSDFGWHVLQVLDSRQQDVGALVQRNQARQVIKRRKYEDELASWLQEIKAEAFIEVKSERFSELEN